MTPRSLLAVWSSLVIAAACASAPQPAPAQRTTLAEDITAQLREHDALPWSAGRPLRWDDFRGIAPSTGEQGALTAYSLFHGVRCNGQRFQFNVVAAFLPRQSWVKPLVLSDPARSVSTLRHEQTHFDVAEVHARRMRRQFATMTQPCQQPTENLEAIAARFVKEEAQTQARYDEETRHGLTAARQRQWDTQTAEQLDSLAKFQLR